MRNGLPKYLFFLLLLAVCGVTAFAQSLGSLSGTVVDPKGAVVAGATVTVKSVATNQEFSTTTTSEGTFNVPSLSSGVYSATISASGFKQAVVTEIKVDVGKPSSINVELEVGSANETVTVVGGGELLQTQSATVGTTLTGRQITDLPNASRDALDLVLTMPGTTTPGRPRTSSVNGLPKGALNISIDGVNVQDNLLKSNDGFFTYIRPRTDAISEVTVSTTSPGAESSAEGAVQIKFVTQNGTNEYHGGLYWYHRNPALNANYWFNNRDQVADPVTHKAPQARILLNQPGGKIGGPISIPKLFNGKDRAFFFVNYEEYRLPERTSRTRQLLTPEAQSGVYRYEVTAVASPPPGCTTSGATAGFMRCSVNVLNLPNLSTVDCNPNIAGNQSCASVFGSAITTVDPTVGGLLNQIRSSVSGLNVRQIDVAAGQAAELTRQQVSFINIGGQTRRFPTVRLDFNPTKKHHIENIWNYQNFGGIVDFLNNVDPAFPDFPNHGSQTSIRWSNVTALRSTLTNNIVNEARMGFVGGITLFFGDVNAGQFANQGGYNLGINATNIGGITNATVTAAPSRRNSPVKQFNDTLTWIKGNHTFNFGFDFTRVNLFSQSFTRVVPAIAFNVDSTNDSQLFNGLFNGTYFPNSTSGQRNQAAALYAVLTGRVTQQTGGAFLDESGKYVFNGDFIQRMHMSEYGYYVQDTWRVRPNITLTFGLRNEALLPYVMENNNYSFATYDSLFGRSGTGNLFKPGTLTGTPTTFSAGKGQQVFNSDQTNFLPSFGFTYSPNWGSGFMHRLMGDSGQTVFRGGFSMASVREGTNVFQAVTGSNSGPAFSANRSVALTGANNLPINTLLRNGAIAPPSNVPSALVYPFTPAITDSVNAFLPNIKLGYVESFTLGVQRELTKDTVIEARYIGNRGHNLWRQYDLQANANIIGNGFLQEFKQAQTNLLANINAGRGVNFRYFGPGTGTAPLPIMLAYLQGPIVNVGTTAAPNLQTIDPTNPAHYLSSNANWSSSTFTNPLNPLNPSALGFANSLAFSTSTFLNNRNAVFAGTTCPGCAAVPASLKAVTVPNFFVVNPDVLGDPFIVDNGNQTYYDALQLELRRRLSGGLLIQGSYTFSKSQSNFYASSSSVFTNYFDLRHTGLSKNIGPYDVTHSFKTNFIYEFPFGKGQRFMSDATGWKNYLFGGWGFNGSVRVQSGNPVNFGNVQVVGMTVKEFQHLIEVRKGISSVFYLPDDVISNTAKAFAVSYSSTTGQPIYTNGAPTGRYLAPAGAGNCVSSFNGECGFSNLVIKGPRFVRPDLSLVKKFRFTENNNLELRAEFLNAFNAQNFLIGSAANDVNGAPLNGIITAAYQDTSTTNDPGGRLVQLVVRWNF